MIQALTIAVALIVLLVAVCAYEVKKRRKLQHNFDVVADTNNALVAQIDAMHKEEKIRNDLHEQTEQKITDLHSGDVVGNAIHGLSKH